MKKHIRKIAIIILLVIVGFAIMRLFSTPNSDVRTDAVLGASYMGAIGNMADSDYIGGMAAMI